MALFKALALLGDPEMRRFIMAAVCGMLVLAGCTDQQAPTEPRAPEPDPLITGCTVTRFPLVDASELIVEVFPRGRLRLEALARVGAIALFWNTCHASAAQKLAVNFVNWMDENSVKLIGTQEEQNELVNLILNGVGVPVTVPTESPGDFGVGFFDPANPNNTLVKTQNNTALVQLEPGSFDEPTTIVISRNSDNFQLTDVPEGVNQFPPYFDYNAVNASGDHILDNDQFAIVGFCLLDPDVVYPDYESIRIGHNPVQINEGAPSGLPTFEILDFVDLADQGLELNCGNLEPNTTIIGGFGRGMPGLANAAWKTTKYYLGPVAEALFLPEALHAATVGTLPPPGGRASSLSPFGIVEVTSTSTSTSLSSSSSLAIVGDQLTLTATVSPAPPTTQEASVEFFDGTTSLGTEFLNSDGVATLTTSSLSLAQHSLTVNFPGTETHGSSSSSTLVQHTVQRFASSESFTAALGDATLSTQDFQSTLAGTAVTEIISGVLNVSSSFDELETRLLGEADMVLFGSGLETRIAGDGRYDLSFVAPLTKNAIAFNLEAKDPATGPASAVLTGGTGTATFLVQNESTSEDTPAFVGLIASVPITTVSLIEGPETGGTGNEETALDDFIVASVPLP